MLFKGTDKAVKGTHDPTCSAALSKSISMRHLCGISMRWSYGHGSSLPADGGTPV